MNGPLHSFACPVCGRVREITDRAHREIDRGVRKPWCPKGQGCNTVPDRAERMRRWWLGVCGITDIEIRRAGGAIPYVLEFGMPELPARPYTTAEEPSFVLQRREGGRSRSLLPEVCWRHADGDPWLALATAVEIVERGLIEQLRAAA